MNAPRLRLRPSLLLGCAACGLTAGWSDMALAQAFQATPTTVHGSVTYNRATPGVETITVNSDTAVIDWSTISPTNPFVFLPAGNVATFRNGLNNADFVALNRILVNVPVRFDGRVVSQLVGASGTSPGGTLLFSTPGGIIIGASAVFDVGNLVLTTLSVNVDAAGNFYDPAKRGFTFTGGAAAPSGAVTTQAGARINAPSPNSYVAFIAPTITHGGNLQVNGAAAFIAGNQVEMRANDGLFDIIVPVGTDSPVPITHVGTIGGPASTDAADIHRIYMVAVPRNQAITMLLQGNIGFDDAVSASVENGEIVLSAGYNIAGGAVDSRAPVNPDLAASLSIAGGTITSSLTGYAVTDAIASGDATGQLHATQDLTLVGGQTAALIAGSGEVARMDRNLSLISPGGSAGIVATGGGSVTISGNVLIDATGIGFSPPKTGDAGNGTGGEARIYADGSAIAISGDVTMRALGIGGNAAVGDYIGAGGNGTGGEILVQGSNGGTVSISGNLNADASGSGGYTSGYDASQTLVNGATGAGGDISIIGAGSGSVAVRGASILTTNGTGGASGFTTGGAGLGDDVLIQASGGNVTLNGPVTISATGTGGQGAAGGSGTGGELAIDGFRGAVNILGATSADVSGHGGNARAVTGIGALPGAGGNGLGGGINIFAESDTGSVDIASFDGHADGFGGGGSAGLGGANGGAGGTGQGGEADIETASDLTIIGARPGIHFGALAVAASGTGGAGGSGAAGGAGAAGTGGQIILAASQAPIAVDGQTGLSAAGTGGATAAGGGAGAIGTGGTITGTADRSRLALGSAATIGANGSGGAGPSGGIGQGGNVQLTALAGATVSLLSAGNISVSAAGQGGAGSTGGGGNGFGGTVGLLADADTGAIDMGSLDGHADGVGGAGGTGGAGGNGQGGAVQVATSSDTIIAGNRPGAHFSALNASADGTGASGAAGGTGTAGRVTLTASQAPITIDGQVRLAANGTGGAALAGGSGATGTGGTILASADRSSLALGTNALIGANGRGGAGQTGGAGQGGGVQLLALGGPAASLVSGGTVQIGATGQGGAGANAAGAVPAGRGGNGSGGSVVILADAVRGSIAFGATNADAGGTGGNAGAAATVTLSASGGDGNGGRVVAGTQQNADPGCSTPAACAAAASGSAAFASLALSAVGRGGQGGTGGNGNGGAATLQSVGAPTRIAGAATLRADAVAGAGAIGAGEGGGTSPGGVAGQAFGGLLVLSASPHGATGTAGQLQAGSVDGSANATGGAAGSKAGSWRVSANGGSNVSAADLTLAALGGSVLPADSRVDTLTGGIVSATGTANLSSAGTVQVNASGTGKLGGGTIRLTAGDDVAIGAANPAAGAVTIDAADIAVAAGDDVTIGAGAVTRGTNTTNVQAGDLASVAGQMLGRAIQLASADINLTGGIGDAGTQAVTLNVAGAAPPTQPATLGGTAQGPGYTLTNAEAARIRADALQVNAPALGTAAGRGPDLIVRDFGFTGGGAGAGIGTLRIVTPGIAAVQGNLLLAGARATDGIAIAATERLELATPNGSIRVRDAAGNPGGTLTINSNNIWAVSQAILDRLHADPAYAARDAELANNGGSQAPRGYVEANAVTLNAGNSLFVQNTGENPTNRFSLTGPAFGGITVGPGGLVIRATGQTPASVTAFGRRINADGSVTTGYDFFFAVDFEVGAGGGGFAGAGRANLIGPAGAAAGSATGYTAASTFNTCIIATGQCPLRRPADTGPGGREPVVGPSTLQLPPGIDDDKVDTSFATEPLIEEPVTSGGESTLWTPPCDPAHDPDHRCAGTHP